MNERSLPQSGEVWVNRKSGERFEVMYAFPKMVGLSPLRDDRSRPLQMRPNNLFQEYTPEDDPARDM